MVPSDRKQQWVWEVLEMASYYTKSYYMTGKFLFYYIQCVLAYKESKLQQSLFKGFLTYNI
jgi:hypothetical protein